MKTIVMYEGGQEHVFTAAKLRIPLQEGGTCDWVPEDEVEVGSTFVTKNGTYKASQEGLYGYDQFTVSVSGGSGSANSSGKPAGGNIKPGGAGSAVVGTDPETGNDVVVGVDEDGNLVQTPVPSGIEIVTEPTKTSYTAGETMDYTGLVVKMVNRDGTTFTDVGHPNGHLSISELIFPVTVAPAGSEDSSSAFYNGELEYPQNNPIPIQTGLNGEYKWGSQSNPGAGYVMNISGTNVFGVVIKYSNGFNYAQYLFSRNQFYTGYNWGYVDNIHPEAATPAALYHDSIIGDYYQASLYSSGEVPPFPATSYPDGYSTHDFALQILGGTIHSGSTEIIPVDWQSPYTSDTYEDSFNIIVTANNSSGGSGGGGSF